MRPDRGLLDANELTLATDALARAACSATNHQQGEEASISLSPSA